jgi:predicted metal-dependent peptidase
MSGRPGGWARAQATPAERIAIARDYVRRNAVYFSKILYGLVFVPVPGLGTMATTKDLVCGYDPDYVADNEPETVAADIAHEILHVLEHHFDRLSWCKDKERANIAADLPINQMLRSAKVNGKAVWPLHETAVMPEHFGLPTGKTAEEYYRLLEKQSVEKTGKAGGQGQSKSSSNGQQAGNAPGQQAGSASGQTPSGSGAQGSQGQPGSGPGQPGQGVCHGHCGSAAGGEDHPALAGHIGKSEVEKKAMILQVEKAVKEFVAQNGRGSVPEGLVDWLAAGKQRSKKNWKAELARILRNAAGRIQSGGDDFSISRPSKRSNLRGIIRPGLIEHLPCVGFVRDSSGSMGTQQLTSAMIEATAILEALGLDEVWFADADAGVATQFQLLTVGEFKEAARKVTGRGGTDFRPAIAAAQKLSQRPELLVYFTDGDGYAPRSAPRGMVVVWCVVESYYNRRPANWGHAVLVTENPNLRLHPPLVLRDEVA